MKLLPIAAAAMAAVLGLVAPGYASTVFGATSVTSSNTAETPNGGYRGDLTALINQSGLSQNYTSGVTDFATFANATTASYGVGGELAGVETPFPLNIDFSFAQLLTLTDFAVWNQSGGASLKDFDLYASALGDFSDSVSLGSFTIGDSNARLIGSFAAADAMAIRMTVKTNYGYFGSVRFNEIAFGGSVADVPVPEVPLPATAGLLFVAVSALGAGGLRKRRAA